MATEAATSDRDTADDVPTASGNACAGVEGTPAEICGYPIDTALSKGAAALVDSFLAVGPGGRGVVLKALEEDCLLSGSRNGNGGKGGLHPSIRERLSRVRELAHTGVANLHGVERDAGRAWMIWEYVQGQSFSEYASAPGRTARDMAAVARELVLTVDSLHMQGIVHGAIKSGNVLVAPGGAVRLTHVSPYLYTDPGEDTRAVLALIEEALFARHEERSPLARLLVAAQEPDRHGDGLPSLRLLGARLVAFHSANDDAGRSARGAPARRRGASPRHRSLAGAAIVTLLGAAAAYGAWRAAGRPSLQMPKPVQEAPDSR